ncbi:Protein of unknown function [Pyronema omphalodes CBS 100304]|uniref:Uncharacterized protein n=1 Tax=Pyronema omphalodes (strain CBS 100304) TaxID=1076935 RepID=U4LGR1_PYROM|nr:Protein of unknown function [Pyronema omphalodes CBS 100304]
MKDANICFHLEAPFDRKVTSYIVSLGCCIFYDQRGCKGNPMFSALNRSHSRLGPEHDDRMRSFYCVKTC